MKILECPDLHFYPERIETFRIVKASIVRHVINHNIDIVIFAGDIWHGLLSNSENSNIKEMIEFIKELSSYCCVCASEGTVSHDPKGSYFVLEEAGLTLLRPGNVYGFSYGGDSHMKGHVGIHNDKVSEMCGLPDAILFGIPELTKKNIYSQLPGLTSDEASGKVMEAFESYIDNFVAPQRLKYKDIPAYLSIHGNISDSQKECISDKKMKYSDIILHTEILAKANLTRITCGHIHMKWESKNCSCGFAGHSGIVLNFGERDFYPSANLIVDGELKEYLRYGTPMIKKVSSVSDIEEISPDIVYWVETRDETEELPEGIHPDSRITIKEPEAETQRVTAEEFQKAESLWEKALLFDPDLDSDLKQLFDEIAETTQQNQKKVTVEMLDIAVRGCILFKHDIFLDLRKLVTEKLTAIVPNKTGPKNGVGKSSLVGFIHGYPVIVGKEPSSGKQSAIKEFFNKKGAGFTKNYLVNGVKYQMIVNIVGAHTQNPKVECALNVAGAPVLEKGTFKELLAICEKTYGSLETYLLTSFYVQPFQSTKNNSSLMTANMVTIRDLVMNIAQISKAKERTFALEKVKDLEEAVKKLNSKIEFAEENKKDTDFETLIHQSESSISVIGSQMTKMVGESKGITADINKLKSSQELNDSKKTTLNEKNRALNIASTDLNTLEKKISTKENKINNKEDLQKQVNTHNANSETVEKQNKDIKDIKDENLRLKQAYDLKATSYNNTIKDFDSRTRNKSSSLLEKKRNLKSYREILDEKNKPCPNCDYIADNIKEEIESWKLKITSCENSIKELEKTTITHSGKEPKKPTYTDIPEYPEIELEPDFVISQIERDLSRMSEIEDELKTARVLHEDKTTQENRLKSEIAAIIIDHEIDGNLKHKESEIAKLRERYKACQEGGASYESDLVLLRSQQKTELENNKKIEDMKAELFPMEIKKDQWADVAKLLMPSKIPALQLEIIAKRIDQHATEIIKPYQGGRFSFRTITKDGEIDRFNIMIHDNIYGVEKSFLKHSPGERAFFSDGYSKALESTRNTNIFIPVIKDEPDGPIHNEHIPDFWRVQEEHSSVKTLVITQKEKSERYINNKICIEDVKWQTTLTA